MEAESYHWKNGTYLPIMEAEYLPILHHTSRDPPITAAGISDHDPDIRVPTLGGWYGEPTEMAPVCAQDCTRRFYWKDG